MIFFVCVKVGSGAIVKESVEREYDVIILFIFILISNLNEKLPLTH